jgi:signal transduction histidine kinase
MVRVAVRNQAIVVDVEDTGIGLAQDTQVKVFEKFFQISPGGSTSSQGLGLGLAICKEIVAAHQGTIHAHSPGLGQGTVITFTLPLSAAENKKHPKTLAA